MIFVTVGSYRFDNLIRHVDALLAEGCCDDEFVVQIANGKYEPMHCDFFRTAPSLASYYERADVVVSHGGVGTILDVLAHGKPLVAVANSDLQDDHQSEFLEMLNKSEILHWNRRLEDLASSIRDARARQSAYSRLVTPHERIAREVDLVEPANRRDTFWRRMIRKHLSSCRQDVGGSATLPPNW